MERHIGHGRDTLTQTLVEMAEGVIRADKTINRLEVAIDEQCLRMLALYQPEANDLCFIAMALSIYHAEDVVSLVEGQNSKRQRPVTYESFGSAHPGRFVSPCVST